MKKNVFEFLRRGIAACGLGPLVLAIVYLILQSQNVIDVLTVNEVCIGIISLSVLAFIAGGINIVYQIERIPLMIALFTHGIILYLDYVVIYLINGWLGSGIEPFLIFTACFFAGYAVVWTIIYRIIKRNTNRLNQTLSRMRGQK